MKSNFTSVLSKVLPSLFFLLLLFASCNPAPVYEATHPDDVAQGSEFTIDYKVFHSNNSNPTVYFAGIMLPSNWTVVGDSINGRIVYKEDGTGYTPPPFEGVMYRSNSGEITQKGGKDDYLNNYEALLNMPGGQYPPLDGYKWYGYRSQDSVPCPNTTVAHIECSIIVKVPDDAELNFYEIQTLFSEQSDFTQAFDHPVVGDCFEPIVFINVTSMSNVKSIQASDIFTVASLAKGQLIIDILDQSMMNSLLNVYDISGKLITNKMLEKTVTLLSDNLSSGHYIITLEKEGRRFSQKISVK